MKSQLVLKNNTISFLRVFALLCILLHHSMSAYYGWPPVDWEWGKLTTFWWEGIVSGNLKMIGLGLFTFLSGFCLYYQNDKNQKFIHFIWKKVKRLLIPLLFFSIAYLFLFKNMMFSSFPAPINGTHLWYVPVIFLCIIITSLQIYIKNGGWLVFVSYILIRKLSFNIDCRTIYELYTYFPIFYSGYLLNLLCNKKIQINNLFFNNKNLIIKILPVITVIIFILFFTKLAKWITIPETSFSISILMFVIYVTFSSLAVVQDEYMGG